MSEISYDESEYRTLTSYSLSTELAKEQSELAEKEMDRQRDALSLPESIIKPTSDIYVDLLETGLVNNFSIPSLLAGSMYTVCRERKIPRNLQEFSAISYAVVNDRSGTESRHTLFSLRDVRSLYNKICDICDKNPAPTPPEKFLIRYCEILGIDEEIQEVAKVALQKTKEKKMSGTSPSHFAIGSLSYALDLYDSDIKSIDLIRYTNINYDTILRNKRKIEQAL